MKLTMPEGLGMLGAVFVGVTVVFGSQGAQAKPSDDLQRITGSVAGTAVDDPQDIPDIEAIPLVDLLSFRDGPPAPRPPINPRAVSLFRRDTRRLEITLHPASPDGERTYRCRGGIEIICESPKLGSVRMEADEALIKRSERASDNQSTVGPRGETWFEDADVPMAVHLTGNAVIRQDDDSALGKSDARIVRASELDYDFVTGRLILTLAKPEPAASRSKTPTRQSARETSLEPADPGLDERSINLLPRDALPVEITDMPRELDGTIKYVCKGGIRFVSRAPACGTVSIEADEAVIIRTCRLGSGETISRTRGGTWIEDEEMPMEIRATRGVILNRSWEKSPGEIDHWTVRADQLDYDVVSGHLSAKHVKIDGPEGRITAASIEVETLARQPAESLVPSDSLDNTPARDEPRLKAAALPSTSSRTTGAKSAPRQSARP
jgi:hypothetical protein